MQRRDPPERLTARFDLIIDRLDDGQGDKEVILAADRLGGPDVVIVRFLCSDPVSLEDEIGWLQRLDSPYVPRILELCIAPGHGCHDAYLVVEFCEGTTLAQLVARGALAVADAAPILVELTRGLAAVHTAGVLHRDLALQNVMLASSESGPQLKLLDLGMAARHQVVDVDADDSGLRGKLPYLPREVIRDMRHDPRSDAYALGVCWFRILTGEFPIPLRPNEAVFDHLMRAIQTTIDLSVLPAELPPAARAILARMLDADRDRRPVMPEVVAALAQAFGAPSLAAIPPVARPRPAGGRRSRRRCAGPTRRTRAGRPREGAAPREKPPRRTP